MTDLTQSLCQSISRREIIVFRYNSSIRIVEPHLLGKDADGDLTLSAWQISGRTGSGWRDFHLAKIKGLRSTRRQFKTPRPGYNQADTTIAEIICRVQSIPENN